jgi:uncharacterized protein YndB with AHSA1/START domain
VIQNDNELIITRVFIAPIRMVFEAWTNPEHLKKWWAPKGTTTTYCTVDLRVGGLFRYCMTSEAGKAIWGGGVYQEIDVPNKIVYTDRFTDKDGNPVPPSYYGLESTTIEESQVEVTFEQENGSTKVTLKYSRMVEIGKEREMARQGWNDMLDSLTDHLTKEK